LSAAANTIAAGFDYQEPGKLPAVVLAVLVHVLLATFLFFGVRWQSKQAEAVEVELWTSLPAPVIEKVEPPPEIRPEPPAPVLEKPVEPPKPDIALEKKKEVKKEPAKKPEPKLNFDRSKDIRAEADRETVTLNQQQLDKQRILDQMKRETTAASAKADAAYVGKIIGKIRSNIVIPRDISGNPEAIFDVVQLPNGEVMSAKLRKSSGLKAYDEAVERAILKASPLPKPDRPEQFQRNLEIKFKPLD
jgi:colicin import membrane protein